MSAVVKWTFEDYWASQGQTVTFYETDSVVNFQVPDTVSVIQVTMRGGAGGGENIDNVCEGGYLVAQIPVTSGETLTLRVGGNGGRVIPGATGAAGGFNGGGAGGNGVASGRGGYGGGGATDIRQGGDALSNRVAVAGGGGGNSGEGYSNTGGAGGADIGQAGTSLTYENFPLNAPNYWAGQGGTQTAGGAGGPGGGQPGAQGLGGNGVNNPSGNGAGGGGAGWYGGGGGGVGTGAMIDGHQVAPNGGGAGGGSNGVAAGVTVVTNSQGTKSVYPEDPFIAIEYTEQADIYTWEINPNDGGTPTVIKNILMSQTVGPNRVNILQEGQSQAPLLDFSGVILTQTQLEAMEDWFNRRILIKVTDDLGREFYGVFSTWTPKRVRRSSNPWYHTYDAEFTLSAYRNASGDWMYGRVG